MDNTIKYKVAETREEFKAKVVYELRDDEHTVSHYGWWDGVNANQIDTYAVGFSKLNKEQRTPFSYHSRYGGGWLPVTKVNTFEGFHEIAKRLGREGISDIILKSLKEENKIEQRDFGTVRGRDGGRYSVIATRDTKGTVLVTAGCRKDLTLPEAYKAMIETRAENPSMLNEVMKVLNEVAEWVYPTS